MLIIKDKKLKKISFGRGFTFYKIIFDMIPASIQIGFNTHSLIYIYTYCNMCHETHMCMHASLQRVPTCKAPFRIP